MVGYIISKVIELGIVEIFKMAKFGNGAFSESLCWGESSNDRWKETGQKDVEGGEYTVLSR